MSLLAILAAAALALASAGGAETVDEVTARLEAQGFAIIEIEQTLLGRIRIRAESDTETREIVIDPATGEVLRDYSTEKGAGVLEPPAAGATIVAEVGRPAAPPHD